MINIGYNVVSSVKRAVLVSMIPLAGAMAFPAQAASVEEACDVMMKKLVASAALANYDSYRGWVFNGESEIKSIVSMAYMMNREALEERWEGLYDFSVSELATVEGTGLSPDGLKRLLYYRCVIEWS